MTTEIAVINRLGVALAADSAITISGFGVQKVFDTGDKLFELCCDHPVGIMVNGNLDFLGVPWEIIIKDFRKSEFDVPTSIEGWAQAFLAFVVQHRAVSEREVGLWMQRTVRVQLDSIRASVRAIIDEALSRPNPPAIDPAAIYAFIISEIHRRLQEVESRPRLHSLHDLVGGGLNETIEPLIVNFLSELFADLEFTADDRVAVEQLLSTSLLVEMSDDRSTGLIVCGFGGDDLFPSLFSVAVDGVVCGKLRYEVTHKVEITRDPSGQDGTSKELGTAISFAQTDVIDRLLRGADHRVFAKSREFMENTIRNVCDQLFNQAGYQMQGPDGAAIDIGVFSSFLGANIAEEYDVFSGRIADTIESEFKRTIALMPKQELIELAEALVSITAVERKASYDAGTVGGPIDVALITRSEGFVWIKRKHHFRGDLNPRYMSRVLASSNQGGPAQ
ncbi:hypothetical protein OVY48_22465 [Sphingobium sp. SA2]|uniref:hypothetical protein n=1 Tax=Sphingobium sp. SA2 TaxID=1524832 RepID=UPI0028C311F5|nr:hypothetical protein [Sphingobium sp. SA2]MDT7536163.1 hypothetical protein [Sphingobium sp. SA2]